MLMLTHALLAASLLAGPVSTDIALPAQPAPLHGTLLTPEAPTTSRISDRAPVMTAGPLSTVACPKLAQVITRPMAATMNTVTP